MKTPAFIFAGILAAASLASAIPNPAAEFCVKCGYKLQIRTDPQGGQYGVCVFPDGSECHEWAYYRKCNAPQNCDGDCNCPWPCPKRIIYVDDDGPADFNNIQTAIDDTNDGDTIVAADGTYRGNGNRDIDFKGKAITVRSENGPENCIIDCGGSWEDPHRGFYFHSGEEANSVLEGLTITNGYIEWPEPYGGGIRCDPNCSPMIKNNVIVQNYAEYGGGIFCAQSPTITNNRFVGNHAWIYGGGIYCDAGSSATITSNMIAGNSRALGWRYIFRRLIDNRKQYNHRKLCRFRRRDML
jgi:putative hemolysin